MKGPVASMGLKRNAHRVFVKNLKERDRLEDISVDVWIIMKWILKNTKEVCGLDSYSSENKLVSGSCEHINSLARSINDGAIADIYIYVFQNQSHTTYKTG
jgi:hypothetical protein